MLRGGTSRFLVAGAVATLVTVASAAPAASVGSPVPRVRIGALSGPTPGPEETPEYNLEVTASDSDGLITEVTVEWTGESYRGITWATRSCLLFPDEPGAPVTMRIPQSLPGPGVYRAKVHAHSTAFCGSTEEDQEGPPRVRRFRVTS